MKGRTGLHLLTTLKNFARSRTSPLRWPRAMAVALRAAGQHGALQKANEFGPLVAIVARLRPRSIVEIGSARGGTLWAWCVVGADDATIVSIDLPGGPFGGGDYGESLLRSFAREKQSLELVRGDSQSREVLENVRAVAKAPVDFLFIDGNHTYEGVRADFELYAPLVGPGGVIALHDIVKHPPDAGCEVDRLWAEIKASYEHTELIGHSDWGGIGVLRVR
jgi:cephalosporin hydroxylase